MANHFLTEGLILTNRLGGNHGAGRQTFQIPVEMAGQGFVKIIYAENQLALRCGEKTEVADMHIPAQLNLNGR